MFSSMFLIPLPYTYCISYLDFDRVNYRQNLGSLFLFSSLLESILLDATQLTKRWHLSCHKHQCRNLNAYSFPKGIQKSGLITKITMYKI